MTISISPRLLLQVLASAVGVLVVLHAGMVITEYGFGIPDFLKLRSLFDMNREQNVPTLFSTLQLMLASLLLIILGVEARASKRGDALYWAGLAAVFLYLAADEFCELHEKLIGPLRGALHTSGALSFAWVIPYAGLVILFAAGFARFWWRLPTYVRLMFALAGAIYVGGGIGMEMLGSKLFTVYGWHSVQFDIETMVEEGMEMTGVAIFVYALATHLLDRSPAFSLRLSSNSKDNLLVEAVRAEENDSIDAIPATLARTQVKRRAAG